ncbi:MAG: sugar phosphate isomerase/epimerase [Spartobacteria bacterium]|nr:sugar phosphate isomerase/epimerase [Spartobacteria bacterium]
MKLSISTHWNASRHTTGEAMIEEILELGLDRVELGYDLRIDLVAGVKRMVDSGSVCVGSVHNFCPVPMSVPRGHPEIWTFADPSRRIRNLAYQNTLRTIEFAAEMGAGVVVLHAGNVKMTRYSNTLLQMIEDGQDLTTRFEKLKMKMLTQRERKSQKHLQYIYEGLQKLSPALHSYGVKLGIENLPTWEAVPTESELEKMLQQMNDSHIGYWHDIGHGHIRQNMGLISVERWLQRLEPWLLGMHIHDVAFPGYDHLAPGKGRVNYDIFTPFITGAIERVLEPSSREAPQDIAAAIDLLKHEWASPKKEEQCHEK